MRPNFHGFFRSDFLVGLLLALCAFSVYLTTMSPSIGYWDSAEIATVLSTLGITHPTGYPLFTLIGWAFAQLPTGMRPYTALNLMVALYCVAAVFLFYRLFVFLLSETGARVFGFSGRSENSRWAAATAVLVLAFSKTFWTEAVSLEVYSLHLVFLAGVTLLFLKALAAPKNETSSTRVWLAFAFTLGLSFSHHMMTVLLAPAFLTLYFQRQGFGKPAWVKIGKAVLPFLAGLLPYLYLPLRAAQNPVMNWGDPDSPYRFWQHVSAAQYRFKMFASVDVPVAKAAQFFREFPAEFGYAPLLLAVAGGIWLILHAKRLFTFTLLIAATCLVYGFNYDFDDPNFYLHAYAATAVWIAFGARWLLASVGAGTWRWGARALCATLVLFPFDLNYAKVDESANYAVEDYVRNLMDPLPQGALVLSDDLQGLIPAAYYLQIVEGVRPDLVVVGHGVLAYPWYLDQLEKRFPGILAGAREEAAAYIEVRRGVERGEASTPAYNARFTALVQALLKTNAAHRPVFVTADIHPGFYKGFGFVPEGLTLRLIPPGKSGTPAAAPREFRYRPIPPGLPYRDEILNRYALAYLMQARTQDRVQETERP